MNTNLTLPLKVRLVDPNPTLSIEWKKVMPSTVDIAVGDIFSKPVDAVVSPGNSFGFMDGGVDVVFSRRFGWGVEERVQKAIRENFGGELLVGQALSIRTGDDDFPVLIYAPTMRVGYVIADAIVVRLAVRAAMREVLKHQLSHVAMPGMGTGTGRLKENWAASYMLHGMMDAFFPKPFPASFAEATHLHFAPRDQAVENEKK